MREALRKITEYIDLRCTADAVWRVLVDKESYGEWYELNGRSTLRDVEPEFCEGGRLVFSDSSVSNKIITTCRKGKELSFGDNLSSETYTIEETQRGSRLSLTVEIYDNDIINCAEIKLNLASQLRLIKLLAYDRSEQLFDSSNKKRERKRIHAVTNLLSVVFKGYKTAEFYEVGHSLNRGINSDEVAPNSWQTAIGGFLALMLVITLYYVTDIEKPSVVVSSGLSIYQSELVSKQTADLIGFDELKLAFEKELSCVGLPLYDNVYSYSSVEQFGENPSIQFLAQYDTHSIMRRYGVINNRQINLSYRGEIVDFCKVINPDMTYQEIERIVGQDISAFEVDKNGTSRYFFGKLDTRRDLFDRYNYAELVVTTNNINDTVTCEFYSTPVLSSELPIDQLTTSLERQFSEEREYEAAKLYGDRVVLLLGLYKAEAEVVLSSQGVETAENEFDYFAGPPYEDDESQGYLYKITYDEARALEVLFINNKLLTLARDTLSESLTEELAVGMSVNAVEQRMGVVPTAIYASNESIVCVYGLTGAIEQQGGAFETIDQLKQTAPIVITFESDKMTVTEILINQSEEA